MVKFDWGGLSTKMGKGIQKVFGSANERELAKLKPIVKQIDDLASWAEGHDQDGIIARVQEWREKVQGGQATLDDALVEMFALTREASGRAWATCASSASRMRLTCSKVVPQHPPMMRAPAS